MAGLRVGDKVLKVNGMNVEFVDHYDAVEVLKACGAVLILFISREVTRLIGHPVFDENGSVSQISISDHPTRPVVVNEQQQQQQQHPHINANVKHIPAPIQITAPQQQQVIHPEPYQQQQQQLQPNAAPLLNPHHFNGPLFTNGNVN
jgi:protein scribble